MNPHALSNPSQLIVRNRGWLECQQLLMVGLPADHLAQELLSEGMAEQITGLSRDFSDYRQINQSWESDPALSLNYAPVLENDDGKSFDGILMFLQKSKPLMDFWLLMAQSMLAEGGVIWLVGENGEGIKSWKKRLKHSFGQVKVIDNARHCVLLEASAPVEKVKSFSMEEHFQSFTVQQGNTSLTMRSLPGVFSHGRLDVGTQILLETLSELPEGRVLDFGCGAGVISAYINSLPGKRDLTLVDCDALAIESSRKTLGDNSAADSFTVLPSDGLSEVDGRFNLIVSNPPFHQGVKTHYVVTEQFLKDSYHHLLPCGEVYIVANSFLKYPAIIMETFGQCETLCNQSGFSIYKAVKR
ncbi:hypothetical protein ACH42_03110 [Endozoicomonas sp. (ex Bugula neritina AB1)]|nr:hypothetical protein ACH42_03110 [Endozoicomonas sp. (ex Bugula neritina AB1)]